MANIRPAILRIEVTYSFRIKPKGDYNSDTVGTSQMATSNGTGFIINKDGLIATANHVVDKDHFEDEIRTQLRTTPNRLVAGSVVMSTLRATMFALNQNPEEGHGGIYDVGSILNCRVFKTDASQDIVVLRCDTSPFASSGMVLDGHDMVPPRRVPTFDLSAQREGRIISVSGFPLNLRVLVTNTGFLSTSYFIDEQGRSLYLADIQINQGNSGGPVYLSGNGAVIGMATAYANTQQGANSGVAHVVPIRRVLALLDR